MDSDQPSFTDVEYGNRRRSSKREQFLDTMNATIPWSTWIGLIEPHYYADRPGKRGRKAKPIATMLRMYLLQIWFNLSDEGVEDAIYDSYAMRRFLGLDFAVEQVPDATTLLHFRHLLEKHKLGEALFAAQNEIFEAEGWIMRGGTIVDATIIAAPSSTKNATGTRDPEMHQTKKGNQWYFGMKAHAGADAGTGYVHSLSATAANVPDIVETSKLMRPDDTDGWGDAGYTGIDKRPEITGEAHLSQITWHIAARKGKLAAMHPHEQSIESRKASMRAKGEHPFLIVKRDFGFTKTRYRGIAKNLNHLHMLFATADWLMRARAVALTPATAKCQPARNRPAGPKTGPVGQHRTAPDPLLTVRAQPAADHIANGALISTSLRVHVCPGGWDAMGLRFGPALSAGRRHILPVVELDIPRAEVFLIDALPLPRCRCAPKSGVRTNHTVKPIPARTTTAQKAMALRSRLETRRILRQKAHFCSGEPTAQAAVRAQFLPRFGRPVAPGPR